MSSPSISRCPWTSFLQHFSHLISHSIFSFPLSGFFESTIRESFLIVVALTWPTPFRYLDRVHPLFFFFLPQSLSLSYSRIFLFLGSTRCACVLTNVSHPLYSLKMTCVRDFMIEILFLEFEAVTFRNQKLCLKNSNSLYCYVWVWNVLCLYNGI